MLNLIRRHPYLLTGAAAAATTLLAAFDERREGGSVREDSPVGAAAVRGANDPPPRDVHRQFVLPPAGGGPVVDALLRSLGVSAAAVPALGMAVTGLAGVARKHPAVAGLGIAAAVAALGACPQVRDRLANTMGHTWGGEDRSERDTAEARNPAGSTEEFPRLNAAATGLPLDGAGYNPGATELDRERSRA